MADVEGVSRQAVYLRVKAYEKKLKLGKRSNGFDINNIPYKGLYEYFKANPAMRICKFTELLLGSAGRNVYKVRRFLMGESETLFKIKQIKTMIEITGKTFEELFERR